MLVLGVLASSCQPTGHDNPDARIRSDLAVLEVFLIEKALDHNNSVWPEFSSHSLPAWADTLGEVQAILDQDPDYAITVQKTFSSPAEYRVPAAVANRNWNQINDEEIIIEVVDGRPDSTILGIRKDGTTVRTSP